MEDIDADKDNDGEDNGEDGEKGEELEDTSATEKMSDHGGESDDDNSEREWPRNGDEDEPSRLVSSSVEEVSDKTVHQTEDKASVDVNESDSRTKPKSKVDQKEENLNGKKKGREGKPFTKVVIRRLPPSMSQQVFLDQVSPLPSYDYFYFVSASSSFPGGYSRAYINFINQNDLFDFTRTFDNYVFIDNKGHEYTAIVEFAPYQRVPKNRAGRKKDALVGTLESDPVYLTFKEQLQAEALENSRTSNKQHYFETEINESEEVVTTPLLEFLKQKRAEKDRIREERREDRKRKEADRKLLKTKSKDKSSGGGSTVASTNLQQDVEIKVLEAPKERKDGIKEKDTKRSKHKEREERLAKAENRTREFKNKGGKSYREERLKQAEKREEKKRKDHEEGKDDQASTTGGESTATTTPAVVDQQGDKDDDKFWNDKKKWKHGAGGDSKGAPRSFTRRREEKKKEMFERKRNAGKSYRSRKGSGELPEDNRKRNESSDNRDKSLNTRPSPDKENTKKDSTLKDESTDTKKNSGNNASNAQKSSKSECEISKEGVSAKEQSKRETTTSNSGGSRKEKLHKESSVDSEEGGKTAKDPRVERRIKNKDRPSIEIYRPGMGKFSRQRLEKEKTVGSTDESPSHSPSPTPNNNITNTSNTNSNNKPV